jgi:hypothetical protein
MQIDEETIVEQTHSAPPATETGSAANIEASETLEDSGEDEGLSDEEKASRKQKGIQKRIDELTKARREAERRADYLQEQLARSAKPSVDIGEKPTLESCDYDQEVYLEKLADYKLQERLANSETSRAERERSAAEQQEVVAFKSRESSVRAEYPDYDQVVYAPTTPISDTMAGAIRKDENGAVVAYFLGKNPDVAYRITQLSPQDQYNAIGDLSDRIAEYRQSAGSASASDESGATEQPKVSAAPPPPPTVTGRGASSKNPEKMTTEEWMEWRSKNAKR